MSGADGTRAEGLARPSEAVDQDAVRAALRTIVDPEIGLDVVTVGLVYDVAETGPGSVRVRYTLTTRGCPLASVLENGMRTAVLRVPGVEAVEMELVWEPAWTPERMETP